MGTLLPLFPLDVVLFPGTPLPLHIFEPRYKEMISECLAGKKPFGVVRATQEAVAPVGCTAEIVEVVKRYDDGRMDIVTEGRQRFELVSVDQERPFLRGEVTYFDDDPSGSVSREATARAVQLFRELLTLAGEEQPEQELEHPQLSFQIVAPFPLDNDFKQTLLGIRNETERLQAVVAYFEKLLPRMRVAVKAREKAGGNGHGR